MFYFKATIQYDGTDYFGFQWQKDLRTIQNDFNQALYRLVEGKVTTMGASRTDTGVHAVEQIVKITSEQPIGGPDFVERLNGELPKEIRCLSISPCEGSFRPSVHSRSKEYRYFFTNNLSSTCVDQRFIANNPYRLDIELMKKCAREVVGQRDFSNFCSTGSNVSSTIREISLCELSEVAPRSVLPSSGLFPLPDDLELCYQLRIEGKGFLKQMVRHLMGALWLVGGGKLSPDDFRSYLNGKSRNRRLWKVATPRGLYLYRFNAL